jgi:hypothetical protein
MGLGNSDIDWASFRSWRDDYIRTKNYILNGKFASQNTRWLMLKIAQMTHSYFYIQAEGKVAFAPPLGTGGTYDETNIDPLSLRVSMDSLTTRMLARFDYDTVLDDWSGNTSTKLDSTIEAQLGRFLYEEESRVIWHTTIDSGIEDRDQTLTDFQYPVRMFTITTGLAGMLEEIGNQITVSDTVMGITNETAVVEEVLTDMEARKVTLRARWSW